MESASIGVSSERESMRGPCGGSLKDGLRVV
jgi:hypothetical protein